MLSLGILLHISLFHISMSETAPCTISEPVGADAIIPISYKGLTAEHHIKWMHGSERVFYRKGSVIKDEKRKIKPDGSLILDNIKSSDSGTYEVTVYDGNGAHVHTSSQHLCVLEPMKKPEVKYSCPGQWPVLTCTHTGPEVDVSWHRNNKVLTGQGHQTLTLTAALFKAGDGYSCTVKNQVSEKKSNEVKPVCSDGKIQVSKPTVTSSCDKGIVKMTCQTSGMAFSWNRNGLKLVGKENTILKLNQTELKSNHTYSCVIQHGTSVIKSKNVWPSCKEKLTLFGMDLWLMVTILAGGGGLVVVLIILSIVCCLCKRKKRQEREKELRLANLTQSPDDDQPEEAPLKRPRRERGPLPEVPKPRVRPAQLHNSQAGPDMKNGQYMHMV
ncbi:uncharacterized protein LOC134077735 [Sardina pilchardus]|uniref:uncharacterized protein LOC134077735 n=1 Tax=Sardina pilchardus TaxID=27697 RepID=UPI002E124073